MFKIIITIFIAFSFYSSVFASNFGEYKYSYKNLSENQTAATKKQAQFNKYYAIQQQIQTQKMISYRNQLRNNNSPTRNIRYPSAANPYPNISRNFSQITPNARYSPYYYKANY